MYNNVYLTFRHKTYWFELRDETCQASAFGALKVRSESFHSLE